MIQFLNDLEQRVKDISTTVVGLGSDPTDFVKFFDDHLHDVDIAQMPFVAVHVTQANDESSEIGESWGPRTWNVELYYLDLDPNFTIGKTRRNKLVSRLVKELTANYNLSNLETVDSTDGTREYVLYTQITSVLFDYSGQDEYYSFVSEIYMTVYTDRT